MRQWHVHVFLTVTHVRRQPLANRERLQIATSLGRDRKRNRLVEPEGREHIRRRPLTCWHAVQRR